MTNPEIKEFIQAHGGIILNADVPVEGEAVIEGREDFQAYLRDFIDVDQSPIGFGETPSDAISDLFMVICYEQDQGGDA